jgi:hypothetical protein
MNEGPKTAVYSVGAHYVEIAQGGSKQKPLDKYQLEQLVPAATKDRGDYHSSEVHNIRPRRNRRLSKAVRFEPAFGPRGQPPVSGKGSVDADEKMRTAVIKLVP